jgi:hypothetical protein
MQAFTRSEYLKCSVEVLNRSWVGGTCLSSYEYCHNGDICQHDKDDMKSATECVGNHIGSSKIAFFCD